MKSVAALTTNATKRPLGSQTAWRSGSCCREARDERSVAHCQTLTAGGTIWSQVGLARDSIPGIDKANSVRMSCASAYSYRADADICILMAWREISDNLRRVGVDD